MQHNIVRKHRRTVSLIVSQNQNIGHKPTVSTFQDLDELNKSQIPSPCFIQDKRKHRLRHNRAISDLIQASNKMSNSKSVIVEQLDVSINYKDPVFEFGKDKKQELKQKTNFFKKSNAKQLDSIVEKSTKPLSNQLFLKKKVAESEALKNSLANKKLGIVNGGNILRKPVQNGLVTASVRPGTKLSDKEKRKEPELTNKETKKSDTKKNFKF